VVAVGGILGLTGCQTLAPASHPPATERATGTQMTDSEPTLVEFDGGGAAAFAEALSTVETEPGSTLRIVDDPHRLDASEAPDTGNEDIRTHFILDGAEDVVEGNDTSLVFEDPTCGALFVQNTLRDVGLVSIATGRPEGIVVDVDGASVYDRDSPSPAGRPHRNVDISDNTVTAIATTGIHLADTEGATVAGVEQTAQLQDLDGA